MITDMNFRIVPEIGDRLSTEKIQIECCKRYLKKINGNERILSDITDCPIKFEPMTECPFIIGDDLRKCRCALIVKITVIENYVYREPNEKKLEEFIK